MSLGLGIFLASLVIAAVMLRDKVRWGRLFIGLVLLLALAVSGFYLYNWYVYLPTYQKQYEDIALGMDRDEVLYIKGSPYSAYYPAYEQKLINEGAKEIEAFFQSLVETEDAYKKGLKLNDASSWTYSYYKTTLTVYFAKNGNVKRVICRSDPPAAMYASGCDSISGVRLGSTEANVKEVFGPPDDESISWSWKTLYFEKYNLGFSLAKQRVTNILIGQREDPVKDVSSN
jgi:hypothetical protein